MTGEWGRVHIGTSGWHYRHWTGAFYPEDLPPSRFLSYYAGRFQTAEVNSSFYRLPSEKTVIAWRDGTPDNFLFTVKASRYLTHMKKLKDPAEPLAAFLQRADLLGSKLGPVLVQLPPNWRCNCERLRSFLDILPPGHRFAFEFRDPSWFTEAVYKHLEDSNAALCIYHLQGFRSPRIMTADFTYIRLHGPGDAYRGNYSTRDLCGWAGAISVWRREGREVFCYFDNDQHGYAAANALELQNMLDGTGNGKDNES